MMQRTAILGLVVTAMGSHALAAPHRVRTTESCPQTVTVSYCPLDVEGACAAYGCATDQANCAEFGGQLRLYCGTPIE